MAQRPDRGHFAWYDLMTSAPEAAIEFYTGVFGWTTQVWESGEGPYTMWVNNGKPIGGVMDIPKQAAAKGAPPNWMAYVVVDDTDLAADKIFDIGGSIHHPPTDIPSVGRFAVITDPQGAAIAIFTPATAPEKTTGAPAVGNVSWCELATSAQAAAYDFYAEIFGWKHCEAMDMGDAGVYQIFGLGDQQFGGIFTKPDAMPGPPTWLYYFRVADMGATIAAIKERGGEIINGPMEVPGNSTIAQCIDPQGALFAIHCTS